MHQPGTAKPEKDIKRDNTATNCSGESEPSMGVQTRHWNHKDRQWLVMIYATRANEKKITRQKLTGKKDKRTKP